MLKRLLPFAITAALAALVIGTIVEAQPVGPVGIGRVVTNSPGKLAGSGTNANPLTDTNSVTSPIAGTGSSGSPLTWSPTLSGITGTGSSGSPLTFTEVGDISSVVAGTGLSGGASSGAATLTVNIAGASCSASEAVTAIGATGTGTCSTVGDITSVVAGSGLSGGATSGAATLTIDTSTTQARVTGTCSSPNAIRAVASDGTVTCTTGVVSSSSLTTNTIPKATGANAIGDGLITDDGTTVTLGGTAKVGKLALTTTTDSTLTAGANNDYALGATTTWLNLSNATGGTITGFTGGVDGRELWVTATGAGNWMFSNETSTSTTSNRLKLSQGVSWGINGVSSWNETLHFRYDGSASRWRQIITSEFPGTLITASLNNQTGPLTTGNISSSGGTILSGFSNVTTTGTINDFAMSSAIYALRWTGTSSATLNGIVGSAQAGRILWIINASTSSSVTLTIASEATGSTAANRFLGPGGNDLVLPGGTANQNSAAFVWYDGTSSRWRVLGGNHFGTGTANTMAKWTAANTLGNSQITDDGTTWAVNTNKVSVDEATGNTTIAGTLGITSDVTVTTTKNKGTIALSTGTGTATVLSGSKCVCSDTTANASVQCAVATTTLTATGTGSDVIAYLCF